MQDGFLYIFYAVFLSQVLLISYLLPRRVLDRVEHVVERYPPARYPRLYPVSLEQTRRARLYYRLMNIAVLVLGLGLIVQGLYAGQEEMLGWDTGTVIFLYYMLQYSPLVIALTAGFTYFNLRRKPDTRSTRSAELRRRRLVDYVSPALLGGVVAVYAAFIVFVAYIDTFDFAWFGGYLNIVFITLMNAFFALIVWRGVYGKKKDPFMAAADRERAIEVTAASLAFISLAATLYAVLSITLAALELRGWIPVATSVYFQIISVAAFRSFRIDNVDFEVYREDRAAAA